MSDPQAGRRKTVCRALTNVLHRSVLANRIDPKAFYMLLSTNFAVLYRDETFDLAPLWDSLAAKLGDETRLYGLFLGFNDCLRQLNLRAHLPTHVAQLDESRRHSALDQAFTDGPVEAVVENLLDIDTGELPTLETHALLPVVSDEQRRDITRAVVQSLKSSAAGPGIDGAQLAFGIDQHFRDLCDGRTFNLEPILDGLREASGFSDAQVFVGVGRMQKRLAELGVALRVPPLNVSEEDGKRLEKEAEAVERAERRRATTGPSRTPTPPPAPIDSSDLSTQRGTKREQRLRRYGLLGISSRRWQSIRLAVVSILLLTSASIAWLSRPNRVLDPKDYPIPLQRADLKAGAFLGILDDRKWYQIPTELRSERIELMESKLRAKGLQADAQIFDQRSRLVIRARSTGQMRGSRFVLLSPDGVQPPPPGAPRESDPVPPKPSASTSKE